MIRLSANPATDTVIKLVTVAVAMFAFVFVVMVPLYDVLCDAWVSTVRPVGRPILR